MLEEINIINVVQREKITVDLAVWVTVWGNKQSRWIFKKGREMRCISSSKTISVFFTCLTYTMQSFRSYNHIWIWSESPKLSFWVCTQYRTHSGSCKKLFCGLLRHRYNKHVQFSDFLEFCSIIIIIILKTLSHFLSFFFSFLILRDLLFKHFAEIIKKKMIEKRHFFMAHEVCFLSCK